jgi:protein gp37
MSDLFHEQVPLDFIEQVFNTMAQTPQHTYQVLTKRAKRLSTVADQISWPSNVWMGVSVESQRYLFRLRHLAKVPAAVRFVSFEPLLGPIESPDLSGIHWAIVGGESGNGARPMKPAWARAIRDECVGAGVPFFFKQWGGRTPKSGGRELDGRLWSEKPNQVAVV